MATNNLGWRDLWFYIGNDEPTLPERTTGRPIPRPEWKQTVSAGDMVQVNELLGLIQAHKHMGVTGAFVMYSFFERRFQPFQKRCRFGFDYSEAEDSSCMCVDESQLDEVLKRVQRVLLDVDVVPYVLQLFSVKNAPPEVSTE